MNDLTVKELISLLGSLPPDGRVHYHSGEANGLLVVVSKNGNKVWSVSRDGKLSK